MLLEGSSNTPPRPRTRVTSRLPWLALLLPALAAAHPAGTSKLDLFLKDDTLEALVDANRDDMFYSLKPTSSTTMTDSEVVDLNHRIAYYLQTRLAFTFDRQNAGTAPVMKWHKGGVDLTRMMDRKELFDTTVVMRLAWRIPPGSKDLGLQVRLFAELETQPICHVRVYMRDRVIRERWLGLDEKMVMPLMQDSLQALLAAVSPKGELKNGDAPPRLPPEEESTVRRFLVLGFTHIIPYGLDHILFVLGLFLFSTYLRPLFIQVTAFTLAHSITLGLSLLGIFSLPARVVEPLIALSIAVVALENIFFRKLRPSRWLIVFGFGLVHGLGFASALKELGLQKGQFLQTLVSFNVGVECGQIAVIAIASALTVWFWKKPWYHRYVVMPVSALIAAVGLYWAVQRVLTLH